MIHSVLERPSGMHKTRNHKIANEDSQYKHSNEQELVGTDTFKISSFFGLKSKVFFLKDRTLNWTSSNPKDKRFISIDLSSAQKIEAWDKENRLGIEIQSSDYQKHILFNSLDQKSRWLKLLRKNSKNLLFFFRVVKLGLNSVSVDINGYKRKGVLMTKNNVYILKKETNLQKISVLTTSSIKTFLNIFYKNVYKVMPIKNDLNVLRNENSVQLISVNGEMIEIFDEKTMLDIFYEKICKLVKKDPEKYNSDISLIQAVYKDFDEKTCNILLDVVSLKSLHPQNSKSEKKNSTKKTIHSVLNSSNSTLNAMAGIRSSAPNLVNKDVSGQLRLPEISGSSSVFRRKTDLHRDNSSPTTNKISQSELNKVRESLSSTVKAKEAAASTPSSLEEKKEEKSLSKQDILKWDSEKVAAWTLSISSRFGKYREKFINNEVDGEMLLSLLTENSMKLIVDDPLMSSILWERITDLRKLVN